MTGLAAVGKGTVAAPAPAPELMPGAALRRPYDLMLAATRSMPAPMRWNSSGSAGTSTWRHKEWLVSRSTCHPWPSCGTQKFAKTKTDRTSVLT
jgi:hypothetical protein